MGISWRIDSWYPPNWTNSRYFFCSVAEHASIYKLANGFYRLHDDFGFIYQVSSTYRPTLPTHWRCQFYRKSKMNCKATVVTQGPNIVRKHHQHNHPSPSHWFDELFQLPSLCPEMEAGGCVILTEIFFAACTPVPMDIIGNVLIFAKPKPSVELV